jgi:hypothetical protein
LGGAKVSSQLFARAEFVAAAPSGERRPFHISVSAPAPHPEGDFSCLVEFGELESTPIFGIDPLQALALAFVWLNATIQRYESDGWTFFHADCDSEPLDLRFTHIPGGKAPPWESPKSGG